MSQVLVPSFVRAYCPAPGAARCSAARAWLRALALSLRQTALAMALLAAAAAHAHERLTLVDGVSALDAWPQLQVLIDDGARLGLADVQQRAADFRTPGVPLHNFGPQRGALWLHLPLAQRSRETRWVLELDYPPLNHIEVHLLRDGDVVQQAMMGNGVERHARPMRTRAHAVTLDLAAAGDYELYIRVQTASAMAVPLRLHTAEGFVAAESWRLLLQGLMFGITLMLLVTSLINGISLRDPVFGYYALLILGIATFFVSYSGLGHQFLWAVQSGPLAKVSPLAALLAVTGVSLFARNVLALPTTNPRIALALLLTALAAAMSITLAVLGLIDYRGTQLAATILGPLPIVLALHVSARRALRGDRAALYMSIGWSAYALGSISLALVLRGRVPADFWMLNMFQFASIVEMFAWMRVLSLRIEQMRSEAERSIAEKNALHSLAHTDPLTGLPNRRGLSHALQAALPAARKDSALAVFLLDLDGFKQVNDRLGHEAGDDLLVQVARRLRGVLRAQDLVARLGGDEFVVMVQQLGNEAAALRIGEKMLDAFGETFIVQGQHCRVGLTIGLAIAPLDGDAAGDLLRKADAAMYAGKQAGRNCLRRDAAPAL